jgi:UDP-3-O-[3-hydroxymyristoyl] N-acetylglucosamine deacetylase/3-hydroxyacyl-[acyl-carrier-protein] dehydratase
LSRQRTIQREVEIEGRGLFTGYEVQVRFKPAPPNSGVTFIRSDQPEPVRIPAVVDNLTKRSRRTSLRNGTVAIETVEHCLAAIRGLDIDNVDVELDNAELPGLDGSSRVYVERLADAGVVEQEYERNSIRITESLHVSEEGAELVAWPGAEDRLEVVYQLDYGDNGRFPRQYYTVALDNPTTFIEQIAPARTFIFDDEAKQFRAAGMGAHLSYSDLLVIGKDGPIENEFRFPDECVRHKILDLIGDLMLVGKFVCGKVFAKRSGHHLNHRLARAIRESSYRTQLSESVGHRADFNIHDIQRLLPHRFPMLLVDRVIEIDGDRRAVGIKNITINEPYFQGHYPRQPIMPGVLIIEAMAQLGGILMAQKLEHTGKIAVLLSLDKVKFRKPAIPGDQLILEAESVRIKSRTGQVRCTARTVEDLVAEAMIRFMLVDADPN